MILFRGDSFIPLNLPFVLFNLIYQKILPFLLLHILLFASPDAYVFLKRLSSSTYTFKNLLINILKETLQYLRFIFFFHSPLFYVYYFFFFNVKIFDEIIPEIE